MKNVVAFFILTLVLCACAPDSQHPRNPLDDPSLSRDAALLLGTWVLLDRYCFGECMPMGKVLPAEKMPYQETLVFTTSDSVFTYHDEKLHDSDTYEVRAIRQYDSTLTKPMLTIGRSSGEFGVNEKSLVIDYAYCDGLTSVYRRVSVPDSD